MPTAEQYAARKAAGKCPRCGRDKLPEWTTFLCVDCGPKAKRSNRKWQRANRKKMAGYYAKYNAKRIALARERGECIDCGVKSKKLRCLSCRKYAATLRAALVASVALVLMTCAPRPQAVEPAAVPTPHCFRLRFAFDGKSESAVACSSSAALCRNAQRRAVTYGGMMQATEVGQCAIR